MKKLETQALELVKELFPDFEKMEFNATVGDASHSIEFFVWTNNERLQCYELADNGEINEMKMESLFDAYAGYVRSSDVYKRGEINKVHFTVEKQEQK